MTNSPSINIKLDFEQVLNLVRQLPKKQQHQLALIIENEEKAEKKFTKKEQALLTELDGAVDFVNEYPKSKTSTKTFKQMLDAL